VNLRPLDPPSGALWVTIDRLPEPALFGSTQSVWSHSGPTRRCPSSQCRPWTGPATGAEKARDHLLGGELSEGEEAPRPGRHADDGTREVGPQSGPIEDRFRGRPFHVLSPVGRGVAADTASSASFRPWLSP
jgi:hypothetical protein